MKFNILPVLLGAIQLHGVTGNLLESFRRSLQGQGSAQGNPGQGQGNTPALPCTVENLPKHPPGAPTQTVLKFVAMGDIPYEESERYCLNQQLRDLDLNTPGGPKFAVHVGDIKWGQDECTEASYSDVAQIFNHPSNKLSYDTKDIFFVVGDNEWVDCREDRELAWTRWSYYFRENGMHGFGSGSAQKGFKVMRQKTSFHQNMPAYNRGENFCFLEPASKTLVCGLNVIGGNKMYGDEATRYAQNLEWIKTNMEQYGSEVKAVVINCHADMRSVRSQPFGKPIQHYFRDNHPDCPVLYIHGNGHDFCVYKVSPKNENFYAVEVEAGAFAPPMIVSVVENTDDGTYVFEIDRQGGLYDPPGTCPAAMEKTWAPHEPVIPVPGGSDNDLPVEPDEPEEPEPDEPDEIAEPDEISAGDGPDVPGGGGLPGSDKSAPDTADAPTPSPTSSPTPSPTGSPTPPLTGPPTPSPTASPTPPPTPAAKIEKVVAPTPPPTGPPTPSPTASPTPPPTPAATIKKVVALTEPEPEDDEPEEDDEPSSTKKSSTKSSGKSKTKKKSKGKR